MLRKQTLRITPSRHATSAIPMRAFWSGQPLKVALASMTAIGMGTVVSPPASQNRSAPPTQWIVCDDELGTGAFGVVHLGVSRTTGEEAAIKTLHERNRGCIQREVAALQQIKSLGGHKNIIDLKDVFEDHGRVNVVTELVAGGELFDHIVRYGACTEPEARRMIHDIAQAVLFLHSNGLIHKDLKPENVLLRFKEKRSDNVAKLADFGSAGPPSIFNRADDVGTSAYLPPELLERKDGLCTQAADMWAVGCILYILLTGMHPFDMDGSLPEEVIESHIRQAKVCFTHPRCDLLSAEAKDLVSKLLLKDPTRRLSAKEMLEHPWMTQQTQTNSLFTINIFHPNDAKQTMYTTEA
ncbi:cleavage induced protein kinase [Achlya hypogyna]|uniref:Cleavage induced protein kinase n=1 Tax=Achlya hypogyna TaxID=1202772 RepID=A0A1V9YDH7_ACHHY|nr:cleavage induced protein kinase [Achlya hypogyna]